jgi:hypothetical protein
MKQCPECKYNNEDNAVRCRKCNVVFNDTSKDNNANKNDEQWPSDEWKDWNLK